MSKTKQKSKAIEPVGVGENTQVIAESTIETPLNRITQITHPKKKAFLEVFYATDGNITKSCNAVSIGRRTYYVWMQNDPLFKELVSEQFNQLLDEIENKVKQEAKNGEGKTALTARIFLLKSRHPDYKPQKETIGFENKDGVRFVISRG